MPDDPTPLGDAMSHRFLDQKVPQAKPCARSEPLPEESPESRPSLPEHPQRMAADVDDGDADPQPGDPKPKAPPSEDDVEGRVVPVELPGKPHAPERV